MTSHSWQGRVALVTGASSGIGAAVAGRLAAEGLRVLAVARRKDRLDHLVAQIEASGGQALAFPADLAQPEERQAVFDCAESRFSGVDVLFNNAGIGWYGYFAEQPWPVSAELLAVNVAAVVHFTRLCLPGMLQRGRGHVINMGSITGVLPVQGSALYGASKSFVDTFTTVLHRELAGQPVHASVIRAGPVRTDFFQETGRRENGRPLPGERGAIPAERVADVVWSLLRRPRRVVYVPGYLRLVPWVEMTFGWLMDRIGPVLLKRS